MNVPAAATFSLDADHVGWVTFDDPAARANVLNTVMLDALNAALDAATNARPSALIIVSGKATTFLAGADLKQVDALPDAAGARAFSRAGQKSFARLENFPAPVVCAIHGACAGGGFELALACHWRIASDTAVTRIGLPETGLGTIPGWGGGVRLSRLVGAPVALAHILHAQLLPVRAALHDGLIDAVVAEPELRETAQVAAMRFARAGLPARVNPPPPPPDFFTHLRAQTLSKSRGQQPALLAAIAVVEQATALEVAPAQEAEARAFGDVTAGPVCKNLLHVFFLREAARKQTLAGWFAVAASRPLAPIARVGVVGAGVMGSGIAHWLAVHGCEVVLRDVQPDFVARGLGVIRGLFDDAVKRGKLLPHDADTAFAHITSTTDWDGFEACDLVIEAIVENAAAKQSLFSELARIVRPDTLLASNTSALPIDEIAGHVPHPERTLGMHFFNPVSRMPLVELVLSRQTSAATAERALALVKSLGNAPIICRSSPGFLVTRVLFFYLNEAVRLWETGVATDELDTALRDFGWPMGPLRLIDEVGIDVTDFIFGEMAHYFPERFAPATACRQLLAAGLKGRKNGASAGFYRYEGRVESTNDAATRALVAAPALRHRAPTEIASHLMHVMIDEARRCLAEGVVRSPDDVDFALLSGTGFPAFRGGLLRFAATQPPSIFPCPPSPPISPPN